jgi:hypothetical protein
LHSGLSTAESKRDAEYAVQPARPRVDAFGAEDNLRHYGKVEWDAHGHLRLGEIEFGRMICEHLARRLEAIAIKLPRETRKRGRPGDRGQESAVTPRGPSGLVAQAFRPGEGGREATSESFSPWSGPPGVQRS